MLSPEQTSRVLSAINYDRENCDCDPLIDELTSPEELHQFALNYNPNDGLSPFWKIIERTDCDKGTVLCIYWLLADFAFEKDAHRGAEKEWDGVGLVERIEELIGIGFYEKEEIAYSPLEFLDWSETKVKLEKHKNGGKFPFPEEMLNPTEGQIIAIEEIY